MTDEREKRDKPRTVGLHAVDDARFKREKKQDRRISGPVAAIAGGVVLSTVLIAKLIGSRTVSNAQEEVLTKQRAAVETVGKEWFPLRDRLEKTTLEAAGPYKGDLVDPEVQKWDLRTATGIYFRLRVADAKDIPSLRKQARDSAKDGFTGCLFRENNPTKAAVARGDDDAGAGWQDQPWNLRLAYRAAHVLTEEWSSEVKATEDELSVRVFAREYEKAQKDEIPLAVDIVKRAQFFLLVLDEDVPEAKELSDGGVINEAALQQVAHPVRIQILNLKNDKELVRVRLESSADFRFAGERPVRDPYTLAAMKRQVQNCSLAQNFWATIHPTTGDAGAP